MKKWTYLLSGVVIGALVATAGSAFADQVKTLVGKKVTGEYTVVVNGKTLQDKGAVIDGRTNVPVRGISNALGVDMKVEGKKIIITSDSDNPVQKPEESTEAEKDNPYLGRSKDSLIRNRDSLKNVTLANIEKERKEILDKIKTMEASGAPRGEGTSLSAYDQQLADYDAMQAKYTKELEQVEEALAALNKK
ncbi:MAG: copper amine oxidase [Paenibacillus dendritiformis]|uniref:copper amine oxidase n=1 Tax=uncultured Paenibacillus sp. TaxID=227322 RepID=UPI0026012A19|nr:copper amine oxidase [uncultured Paenibacillus sp.]MDU5143512.1 copper amine oxidase [Paenibacillus dendritiformis]